MSRSNRRRRYRKNRKAAMCLAIFLGVVDMAPQDDGQTWAEMLIILQRKFHTLDAGAQKESRRLGWCLICERGLRASAALFLPNRFFANMEQTEGVSGNSKLAKCPHCRTWQHKSIWPTKEAAESFCKSLGDTGLQAYLCPHGFGWHLGHNKKEKIEKRQSQKSAIVSAPLEYLASLISK